MDLMEAGDDKVRLSAIGPRPGTSQFAADRNFHYDEVHVAVIDRTGGVAGTANTVLRDFYLSKLSDGKASSEWCILILPNIN